MPAIGLDTALVGLGLQGDGTVEVPADPLRAGWYRLGPPPGAVGSAVVLGHVDSVDGPAVFARLGELGRGDRVLVTRDDGTTARFVVRSTTTYANDRFPPASSTARTAAASSTSSPAVVTTTATAVATRPTWWSTPAR